MTDLVLGITLKADGDQLKGELKLSRRELDRFTDGVENTRRRALSLNNATQRMGRQFSNTGRQARLLHGIIVALATGAMARLAKSFIDAASTSEQYRVRLKVLLRDVGEANRLFDEMRQFASEVPFEFQEIMGSATQLAGVLRGGVDEIGEWIPLIGDLAATSGLSIQETTTQVIRMLSAGAAAADLFRERGILAMLGFQAGVAVSAEETRKRLMEAWTKADSQFRGATNELAKTWVGLTSMMSDSWFNFQNQVMDAAPFDFLKGALEEINARVRAQAGGTEALAQSLGENLVESFKAVALGTAEVVDTLGPVLETVGKGLKTVWRGYRDIAEKEPLVAEFGLIGAVLLGRKGIVALALISTLDDAGDAMNKATQEFMRDLGLPQGVRDFMNDPGAFLRGQSRSFGGPVVPAPFPDVNFTGEGAPASSGDSLRDQLAEFFAAAAARAAAARAQREAEAAASGGRGSTGRPDRAAALSTEQRQIRDLIADMEAEIAARQRLEEVQDKGADSIAEAMLLNEQDQALRKAGLGLFEVEGSEREAQARKIQEQVGILFQLTGAQDEALESSRRWEDGATRAFRGIADEAGDMASHMEGAIGNAFGGIEDAFVELRRTGEFNMQRLADAVIDDLIRIQVRTMVTQPLASFLGDLSSGFFLSGGGSGGGGASPVQLSGGALAFHGGGIVGGGEGSPRMVDPRVFIGAPRFHGGGVVGDEVPTILRRREGVFTPEQMRALGSGGGTTVNVIDQRGAGAAPVEQSSRRGPDGNTIIDLRITDAVNRGLSGGAFDGGLETNYGIRRQGYSR